MKQFEHVWRQGVRGQGVPSEEVLTCPKGPRNPHVGRRRQAGAKGLPQVRKFEHVCSGHMKRQTDRHD